MEGLALNEDKPEIRAWMDLVMMRTVPVNKEMSESLKQYEEKPDAKKDQKGI